MDDTLYGPMGDVPFEVASDTSADAAASISEQDLGRLEALVFDLLIRHPQTCDDVEAQTGLAHQTISARIRGLVLRGRVEDSGQRSVTRSGRRAVVWQVKKADPRG